MLWVPFHKLSQSCLLDMYICMSIALRRKYHQFSGWRAYWIWRWVYFAVTGYLRKVRQKKYRWCLRSSWVEWMKEGKFSQEPFSSDLSEENPPIFDVLSDLAWKQVWEEHLLLVLALVLLLFFITFCHSFGNCLRFIFYSTWHKYLSILQEDIYLFHRYLNFLLLFASGLCCIISGQRPMHSYGSPSLWATSLNYHYLTVWQKSPLLLEGKPVCFTVICIPEFSCVLRLWNKC